MEERRRRQRLPWIEMQAQVKLRKGLLGSKWIEIDAVDYSRLGMGMGVRQVDGLKIDDNVRLNLKLSTETGEIVAENVQAVVRHRRSTAQGMILGIDFGDAMRASTTEALARIEGIMSRHQYVSRRIKSS